jgi:hypothetical protein
MLSDRHADLYHEVRRKPPVSYEIHQPGGLFEQLLRVSGVGVLPIAHA